MPTTPRTNTTVSSLFVPAVDPAVDGLPEPLISRPWTLKTSNFEDDGDDLPTTSQSWPPAISETPHRSSFGAVGERIGYDDDFDDSEVFGGDSTETWSPAAAFLNSFMSPTSPTKDVETIAGYVLGATIGYGGFSTIKEATTSSGGVVAVKIVRHSAFNNLPPGEKARQRSRLSHEARVWVSLSHENILPLFDSHSTSEATYLITLYCPSGSLLDILKREGTPALEQTDAGCMFRQVVKAIQYLHESMSLVHGDIKLENVLVDESGVCRLADFGLTRQIGGDSSQVSSSDDDAPSSGKCDRNRSRRAGTSALPVHLSLRRHHGPQRHRATTNAPPTHPDHMFQPGSLPYAAPELLLPHTRSVEAIQGQASRPTAHPAQDMWALGVMLYALLTGRLPFCDSFEPRLQMKILRGAYDMPHAIGPLAESVLKGCLERDVSDRWTISMVDDASWGIGYGNIDLDPVICDEQRSQSESRTRTPSRESPPAYEDLTASISSCSLSSSPPKSRSRGRPSRIGLRNQSRSPSPSVAPRTPVDEEAGYFGHRHRRRRDPKDVQVILEDSDDDAQWDVREMLYDVDGNQDVAVDKGKLNGPRGRQVVGEGLKEARKRSQSRPRSWSMNELMR
ncbi:kinase-like protein [Ramaria rubella]|nr:kinase-like protein [Ramaria rubella]